MANANTSKRVAAGAGSDGGGVAHAAKRCVRSLCSIYIYTRMYKDIIPVPTYAKLCIPPLPLQGWAQLVATPLHVVALVKDM